MVLDACAIGGGDAKSGCPASPHEAISSSCQ